MWEWVAGLCGFLGGLGAFFAGVRVGKGKKVRHGECSRSLSDAADSSESVEWRALYDFLHYDGSEPLSKAEKDTAGKERHYRQATAQQRGKE